MLKRTIKYEDFEGNPIEEEFYFNLSKSELIELEVQYEKGLADTLQDIVKANDTKSLVAEFKKLVLLAYGQKSLDGKRFIKSDELREEFAQSLAYDSLFMELATDDKAAASFIQSIVPRDLGEAIEKARIEGTPGLPPPPAPAV